MKVTHPYQLRDLNRRVDKIFERADRIVNMLGEKKDPHDYARIKEDYEAVRREVNIYLGYLRADTDLRYPTSESRRKEAAQKSLTRLTCNIDVAETGIEVLKQVSPQNGSAQLIKNYHEALDGLKRLIEQSEGKSEGKKVKEQ